MVDLFLQFFNLSISASWLVLAVLVARPVLDRLRSPKWVSPLLWGLVGLRLALPFSIPSPLSLVPSAQTLSPQTVHYDPAPTIRSGVRVINNAVNPVLRETFAAPPTASVNPLDTAVFLAGILWAAGILALALYALISYLKLCRRVSTAVLLRDNIFQSEQVHSPFVLGLFRPKIYLPFGMPEVHMDHVIAHENAHLRRGDHWAKPLGFLLLTLYWFNPLMWVSYALLCRDLELACDERVIRDLDTGGRADYSQALLSCGVPRRSLAVCPLAFGEVGLKARIKSVLSYKKPAFWAVLAAVALCVVLAVCFLTDPAPEGEVPPSPPVQTPAAPDPVQTPAPDAAFRPVMWFDRLATGRPVLGDEFTLDQFPGVTFRYDEYKLEAEENGETVTLYAGMPIESLYLADLTGDGKPEFCSVVSVGSGVIDARIRVYDYAAQTLYELSDRMVYDFTLSLEGEVLMATRSVYAITQGGGSLTGPLVLQDGALKLQSFVTPEDATLEEAYENLKLIRVYNGSEETILTYASVILGMQEDPDTGTGTVYTLQLDRTYAIDLNNGEPRVVSSAYTTEVYTFVRNEYGQYVLDETWRPAGGEGLADNIWAKLPPDLPEKALHPEEYTAELGKQCEEKFWLAYEYLRGIQAPQPSVSTQEPQPSAPDKTTLEGALNATLPTLVFSNAPKDRIHSIAAELLGMREDPEAGSGEVYYLLLCCEYAADLKDGAPQLESSYYSPTVLTFLKDEDGQYYLDKGWSPDIGEDYTDNVRAEFPPDLAEKALHLEADTAATLRGYCEQQFWYCYENADGLVIMNEADHPPESGITVWSWGDPSDGMSFAQEADGIIWTRGISPMSEEADGTSFTVVLEKDGTVWAWGDSTTDQLEDISDRIRAVSSDGTVWTWGSSSPPPTETGGPE